MRKLMTTFLAASLLVSEALLITQPTVLVAAQDTSVPAPPPRPSKVRPQHASYVRQTHARRHSRITKKQIAVMAAVAGTSMGIGALAGGGKGLAIGAIVGGWGAYLGRHLWARL